MPPSVPSRMPGVASPGPSGPPALTQTQRMLDDVNQRAKDFLDRLPEHQVPTVSLPGQPMTFDDFEPKVINPKQYNQQQLNYFRSYWLRAYDCYLILFQWLNACLSEAEMRYRENSVFPGDDAKTRYFREKWVCSEAFKATYKNSCIAIPYNSGQGAQRPLN